MLTSINTPAPLERPKLMAGPRQVGAHLRQIQILSDVDLASLLLLNVQLLAR